MSTKRPRLAAGDLVRCRIGNDQPMTVDRVSKIRGLTTAECVWTNAAGGRERRTFRVADLELTCARPLTPGVDP